MEILEQLEKQIKIFWKKNLLRINHDFKNENIELILINNNDTKLYLRNFKHKLDNYYPFVVTINYYELNEEEFLFDIYYKK